MALTDTFVKNVKPPRASGDKYADGDGMYLLVTLRASTGASTTGFSASARPSPWACTPRPPWPKPVSAARKPER
jgi:hypothetical protein